MQRGSAYVPRVPIETPRQPKVVQTQTKRKVKLPFTSFSTYEAVKYLLRQGPLDYNGLLRGIVKQGEPNRFQKQSLTRALTRLQKEDKVRFIEGKYCMRE